MKPNKKKCSIKKGPKKLIELTWVNLPKSQIES
jgi:hypothetical protein